MKTNKTVLVLVLLFMPFLVFAGEPRITSVTMNPASPGYGDLVTINVTACVDKNSSNYIDLVISNSGARKTPGSAGQVYMVSIDGVNVPRVNPNVAGAEIGYLFAASNPAAVNDCTDCSGDTESYTITKQYVINMPASTFFGSCGETGQLYLHAAMKSMYLGKGDWMGISAVCPSYTVSAGWAQPIPVQNFTVAKSVEGTLQAAGDMLLYKVDYTYQNGSGFRIVDNIPAGFTVVSYGPTTMPGGTVTAGNPIIWNFPSMTGLPGQKSGTVWMLLQWDGAGAGPFTNTATGSWAGAGAVNTSVTTVAGAAALKITKTQSKDQLLLNETMTYYMSYEISGYALKSFSAFDDATGVYSGGSAPPGWKSISESGTHGTWTAEDPCNTGNKYITGSSTQYPGLALDDGNTTNASDQFCDGMIVSDFMIGASTTFPGADAQIIFRSNGLTGTAGVAYGILASIDSAPSPGYLMFQKCMGGCSYPAGGMPSIGAVVAGKWYRMRINVTNVGTTGQTVQARVWARGDPEPSTWDINYTDATALSNGATNCTGTGTWNDWRPGVNEQSGDYDDVLDSYDNFTVYGPRSFTGAPYVHDDVPAGMIYLGCSGCSLSGGAPRWTLPSTSFQSGSLTWWARATTCGSVSNQALINGGSDIFSNWVNADVLCWSPTFTPTVTRTFTETVTPTRTGTPAPATSISKSASSLTTSAGDTVTYIITYQNNWASVIVNYSIWDTVPAGITLLDAGTAAVNGSVLDWSVSNLAPSAAGAFTWTGISYDIGGMSIYNSIRDNMGAMTASATRTSTSTYSPTRTATPTFTASPTTTFTRTMTFTGPTGTHTNSFTVTRTLTSTAVLPITPSMTFTETQTPTITSGTPCTSGTYDLKVDAGTLTCPSGDRRSFTMRVYNRSGAAIDVSRFTIKTWFNSAGTISLGFNDRRIENQADTTLNAVYSVSPYVCAGAPGRLVNQQALITLSGNLAWTSMGVLKIDGYVMATGENPFDPACDDYTRFTGAGDTPYVGLYLDGVLVSETQSDCSPDPLTGVEPCSIPTPVNTATLTRTITQTVTPTLTWFPTPAVCWADVDGSGTESLNVPKGALVRSDPGEFAWDSAGRPHVAFSEGSVAGENDIFYLKWNGIAWVDADGTGTESMNSVNSVA
jgi:uncharacterized repeat protein (TIGR01451 family)